MFTQKVAKPQTKAAWDSKNHFPHQHWTLLAHRTSQSFGNQAILRLLAQRAGAQTGDDRGGDYAQKADRESGTPAEAPGPLAWDFSRIPAFPPDRTDQSHVRSALTGPLLTVPIQLRFKVGPVDDDPLEREADRVAEQVMRIPEPGRSGTSATRFLSSESATSERVAGDAQKLGARPAGTSEACIGEASSVAHNLLRSPGQPLDRISRNFFEPRFGVDFSHVRVHLDDRAVVSARDMRADAFTMGPNIAFAAGRYAPGTAAGRQLIAHELAHVVQQDRAAVPPPTIRRQPAPAPVIHRPNIRFDQPSNRIIVDIDGIPVAEVLVLDANQKVGLEANVSGNSADVVLYHYGNAMLAASHLAMASPGVVVSLREVDLRQGQPGGAPREPPVPGSDAGQLVDIAIVPASALQFPGETKGETGIPTLPQPGALSQFEQNLLRDRSSIMGGVLDPGTREVIGYRLSTATGLTRIVDREGTLVHESEIGLETPVADPIDLIPSPGTAFKIGKAGVGIAGKVVLKGLLKKEAAAGTKLTLGVVVRMRGVAKALAGRAAREAAQEGAGLVRKITKEGLSHSFDRHAAQWFGRAVSRETHMDAWRGLIERATASRSVFPWSTGASETVAHLAQIEGKYFVVQFYTETGELATAFVPNSGQLREMLRLLR